MNPERIHIDIAGLTGDHGFFFFGRELLWLLHVNHSDTQEANYKHKLEKTQTRALSMNRKLHLGSKVANVPWENRSLYLKNALHV